MGMPVDDARVLAALPFVRRVATRLVRRHRRLNVNLDDVVQSGVLGVMATLPDYDPAKGLTFEQFAYLRVRGAMIDDLRRGSWPRGLRRKARAVQAAADALVGLGLSPTAAALAERLRWPEADVTRCLQQIEHLRTLTRGTDVGAWLTPVTAVTVNRLKKAPPPSTATTPEQFAAARELRRHLNAALATLEPRERQIVWMFYVDDRSIDDAAAALRISRSRVFQLKVRAFRKLAAQLAPLGLAA